VGAIIAALRPGDHEGLNTIADRWGRPAKEVAGILLEEAIRRETRPGALTNEPVGGPDRKPAA
jgi:hypothetical protein